MLALKTESGSSGLVIGSVEAEEQLAALRKKTREVSEIGVRIDEHMGVSQDTESLM